MTVEIFAKLRKTQLNGIKLIEMLDGHREPPFSDSRKQEVF